MKPIHGILTSGVILVVAGLVWWISETVIAPVTDHNKFYVIEPKPLETMFENGNPEEMVKSEIEDVQSLDHKGLPEIQNKAVIELPYESLIRYLSGILAEGRFTLTELSEVCMELLPQVNQQERNEGLRLVGMVLSLNLDSGEKFLKELSSFREQGVVIRSLIDRLMEDEPLAAAQWSSGIENANLRKLAIHRVTTSWASEDLNAAIAWASELVDTQDLSSALEGITWTWAQKDPVAVYHYATSIEDDRLRNLMFLSTAKMMAHQDPEATSQWVVQFPSDIAERKNALFYSLFQWASKDVLEAVNFAMKLEDSELQDSALLSIVSSWSVQDPAAATEWAQSIENESIRLQAWSSSVKQWAEKDPSSVANWIGKQDMTEIEGNIMRQIVATIGRQDPQSVQDWIQGLPTIELQRAVKEAFFEVQSR